VLESLSQQFLRPLRPSLVLGLHFLHELHALLVARLLGVVDILLASLGPLQCIVEHADKVIYSSFVPVFCSLVAIGVLHLGMFLVPHPGNLAKTDPLGMGPFYAKRFRHEASRREPLVNFATTRGGIIDQYAVGMRRGEPKGSPSKIG